MAKIAQVSLFGRRVRFWIEVCKSKAYIGTYDRT